MKNKCSFIQAILTILLLIFSFNSIAFAQETTFSGTLSSKTGMALPYTKKSGDYVLSELRAQGELSVFAENSSLYLNGFLVFDESNNKENTDASLKEAWLDYEQDFWALRIGRQISAWGKADGLSVTDILCPKDNTQLLANDYTESRLGIDALRLSVRNESYLIDAYWIPFFTPEKLPSSDFSDDNITLPEAKIKNSEYAVKLCAYWDFADVSLYGFYGFDDEPCMIYTAAANGNIMYSGSYKKIKMFGADAAIPVGELVFRLEGAFFPERYFSYADSFVQYNQLKFLVGLDWMPSAYSFSVQYYADILMDKDSFKYSDSFNDSIGRKQLEHITTLSASKSFLNETLTLSVDLILALNYFDSVFKPKTEYALNDHITFSLEGNFFNKGKNGENGTYGLYKDLSCMIIGFKFSF